MVGTKSYFPISDVSPQIISQRKYWCWCWCATNSVTGVENYIGNDIEAHVLKKRVHAIMKSKVDMWPERDQWFVVRPPAQVAFVQICIHHYRHRKPHHARHQLCHHHPYNHQQHHHLHHDFNYSSASSLWSISSSSNVHSNWSNLHVSSSANIAKCNSITIKVQHHPDQHQHHQKRVFAMCCPQTSVCFHHEETLQTPIVDPSYFCWAPARSEAFHIFDPSIFVSKISSLGRVNVFRWVSNRTSSSLR